MLWFCCLGVFFQPSVNKHSCQTQLLGYGWERVLMEPSSLGKLRFLQFQLSALVFGEVAHHQTARVWPRLRLEVTQILYLERRLLHDFSLYGFLKRFSRLDESGYATVEVRLEILCVDEEQIVTLVDEDDDGCGKGWPHRLAARAYRI